MPEQDTIPGYSSRHEHLEDELHRLDLQLTLAVQKMRETAASSELEAFRGLVIPDQEIDALLRELSGFSDPLPAEKKESIRQLQAAVQALETRITARTSAALKQGIHLPLLEIEQRFGLLPWDIDILILCLAPEVDLRYEKLYAYLQDNVTSKRPTMDLALRLRWDAWRERLPARAAFSEQRPLFRYRLISFVQNDQNFPGSFLSRGMEVDEHLVKHILGIDEPDQELLPFANVVTPTLSMQDLALPAGQKTALESLFEVGHGRTGTPEHEGGIIFNLHGPEGVGKKAAAGALCKRAQCNLLVVDVPGLLFHRKRLDYYMKRLTREALLHHTALYFDKVHALLEKPEIADYGKHLLQLVSREFPGTVFLGNSGPWVAATPEEAGAILNVRFDLPSPPIRRRIWEKVPGTGTFTQSEIRELADRFKLTPGKIHQAAAVASHLASTRQRSGGKVTLPDLYQACRIQSSTNLNRLAQKITPLFTWDDIILPGDSRAHLREICLHVRYHQQVFSTWAFDTKISLGKGISVLFAGPPGTGKTMGAEVIASELGLDLYKIDLSTVVSKYIGETEKNLSRIFREAENSNAILFFDEADALFGKRSEVKDSHDRYANIEINYLLQQMEEYEGIVILATNFQKNIDEAFTRRLRFIVDFPFPDERYRAEIWRNIFPAKTPRHQDIDFQFLARKFEIAGGHIKNIALSAAFLAAENSGMVGMEHIIRAAKREFQKMGRMVVKSDFDEYFDLLKTNEQTN